MAQFFPNGTQYAVSKTLAAAIAITGLSNANPAVASAATQPADGSVVILSSGWPAANNTVRTTDGKDADSFELVGLDTTNTALFPAGAGAGSAVAVVDWTPLSQVRSVGISGGDQQYFSFQYVDDTTNQQQQKPTTKNPVVLTFGLDYDPDLPWYEDLKAADRAGKMVVVRATMPSGAVMYYLAWPSFQEIPTQTVNENMQNTATFSLVGAPLRVEAA